MDIRENTREDKDLSSLVEQLQRENAYLRHEYIKLKKEYDELKQDFRKVGVHAFRNVYN